MPTLVDRSFPEDPFVVFESGAIIQYLCRKYPTEGGGALAGLDDPRAMSEVEQWVMWQVSGLGPMTGQAMYFKRIASPVMEDQDALKFSIQRYEAEALRLMHVLESRLAAQKEMKSSLDRPMSLSLSGGRHSSSGSEACYLVGNRLTLADIACYGYAACHWWTGISEQVKEEMPHVEAWLELLGGRASLQAAFRVPGIAPIPGAPTFAELFVLDTVWQAKLEEHAKAAGRPHFGWRDLSELCKKDGDDAGPTLFQADIESINENKG